MKKVLAEVVGQRIKEIRTSRNLIQKNMACLLEMQLPSYSRYERGERIFPLQCILQIAMHFNIDSNYILGVTNTPAPYPKQSAKAAKKSTAGKNQNHYKNGADNEPEEQ